MRASDLEPPDPRDRDDATPNRPAACPCATGLSTRTAGSKAAGGEAQLPPLCPARTQPSSPTHRPEAWSEVGPERGGSLRPARFSGPLPEPGVRLPPHAALHEPRCSSSRSGRREPLGPRVRDLRAAVAVPGDRHRRGVEEHDPGVVGHSPLPGSIRYNRERLHWTLGMLSPEQFENRTRGHSGASLAASRLASTNKIIFTSTTTPEPPRPTVSTEAGEVQHGLVEAPENS